MCHLDGMKVAKSPLILPPPYDEMWLKVEKVNNINQMSPLDMLTWTETNCKHFCRSLIPFTLRITKARHAKKNIILMRHTK